VSLIAVSRIERCAFTCRGTFSLAVLTDGSLTGWGVTNFGALVLPHHLREPGAAACAAAGMEHALALVPETGQVRLLHRHWLQAGSLHGHDVHCTKEVHEGQLRKN
jgi:hypothetical protein